MKFIKPICREDIKNNKKLEKLLTEGKRIPCFMCLDNDGYILYTSCCG